VPASSFFKKMNSASSQGVKKISQRGHGATVNRSWFLQSWRVHLCQLQGQADGVKFVKSLENPSTKKSFPLQGQADEFMMISDRN
jgi:hypothetical protein